MAKAQTSCCACPVPVRYVIVLIAHFGFMVVYGLRVNMSVAIIAMVNSTFVDASSSGSLDPECQPYMSNTTTAATDKIGSFKWDQRAQGLVLSSFFYGYIVMQIPAAWLCTYVKATTIFGVGILLTSLLTLLTPVIANYSFALLVILRVVEGLCEGVTFPTMHSILSRWAPPSEVTFMAAIAYSGTATGTFIALSTSGFLCNSDFLGGWPLVFYSFGTVGILWYVFWFFLVYDSPLLHPWVSHHERTFIIQSVVIKPRDKYDAVPWKEILTSMPVWSLFLLNFCGNWFLYTMLTGLPSFFKEVLNFPLRQNGIFSALPYAASLVFTLLTGRFCDWTIRRGFLSRTAARKVFTLVGLSLAVGLTIAMTFCGCNHVSLTVALLTIGYGFFSFASASYGINHLDMAPKYADIIIGFTNTAGTLAGCLSPLVIGALTQEQPTRQQWQLVMYITAGVAMFGCFVFLCFGDGNRQPWSEGRVIVVHEDDMCAPEGINEDASNTSDDRTALVL